LLQENNFNIGLRIFEVGEYMSRKAVDVVLLPTEAMIEIAVEANRELVKRFGEKIVLNKENCLPHISLAMGCVDERDITAIKEILRTIAEKSSLPELKVIGIQAMTSSVGEKVSAFEVEKTKELQLLHKEVMEKLAEYLSYDVTKDMIYGSGEVGESTLLWIRDYREKSSFANFFPHITVGYGEIENLSFPIKFTASELALCHLGNHCTCRKVLASIELGT
jgi:2'-5' RNA ligase